MMTKSTFSWAKTLKSFAWTVAPVVAGFAISEIAKHPEWVWGGLIVAILRMVVDKATHPKQP